MDYLANVSDKKNCQWCSENIPLDATVCRQCRNFQGWRWYVRLFGVSLAWISVIFYVASVAITGFTTAVKSIYPIFDIQATSARPGSIYAVISNDLPFAAIVNKVLLACEPKIYIRLYINNKNSSNFIPANSQASVELLPENAAEVKKFQDFNPAQFQKCSIDFSGIMHGHKAIGIAEVNPTDLVDFFRGGV